MTAALVLYARDEENLRVSADYVSSTPGARSAARHELMDTAEKRNDLEFWREIARDIIESHKMDDLTPQVSDHFVRTCPDDVFKEFADQGPQQFFRWRMRQADLLLRSR
jgi:cytosine/adenosine deaminase-related metal-dependent hydrolase